MHLHRHGFHCHSRLHRDFRPAMSPFVQRKSMPAEFQTLAHSLLNSHGKSMCTKVSHEKCRGRGIKAIEIDFIPKKILQCGGAMKQGSSHVMAGLERESGSERERARVLTGVTEMAVLDMGAYYSEDVGSRERFVEELRDQCHRVGLFYVKNHGVSLGLCEDMLAMARKFFDLPVDVKLGLDYRNSAQFRGYMKIGVENTAGLIDHREQIEFAPEEVAATNAGGSAECAIYPVYQRLRGPNQWPPDPNIPEFRSTVMKFMEHMNVFSMHLMQALALSLCLDQDYFDSTFRHSPHYQMKVVRYPPKPTADDKSGVGMFGVGPHSDTGFLSLLLQDNVGGLQAQTIDGEWIDVPPREGTFVVNLGEMLQVATRGYYLATVHRVLSLPGTASRYSIPFFFNPCLDAEAKPIDISVPAAKEGERLCLDSRTVRGGESTHGGRNKLHPVFGMNTFKSFARSHPEVVKRHHPDLMDSQGDIALGSILAS